MRYHAERGNEGVTIGGDALDALNVFQNELQHSYEQFQVRFGAHVRGVIEIGSYARDENISCSDHDLRLIIDCPDPLYVLNEETWTERPEGIFTPVEWEQLNHANGISFGLTNLAYVQKALLSGRYPLVDHTCIYQGRILIDEAGAIGSFRSQYQGARFSNIVPDYLRQTAWRITDKLPGEMNSLTERFDANKYALPALHTCYRIVRDLANISRYDECGSYFSDYSSLRNFYRTWPWFEPTLERIRAYKVYEAVRRAVFHEVMEGKAERITEIKEIGRETVKIWEQFQERYREAF